METEIETVRYARIVYQKALTIQDGSDLVYLTKEEIIQLRDFLNQLEL